MTTTGLYDLVTSAGDNGTMHPAEQIWTPDQDSAVLGFTPVLGGLHIIGLPAPDADEGDHPALFVLLGHHRWATTIHAAALYMDRAHAWNRWCLYPGDDPDEAIPRIPRAVHAHAAIQRHPDDTWYLVWARPDELGTVQVTAMRHPAALATAAAMPDPDRDPQVAVWAR
ncbi:hypothetical protein OG357_38275 (plasmid) [Streptomyces sp. NBC_01255]|uniref:hypothetical protein n=1 Tax=Streptomyces sp. NBC_01255 TaxID=2903798 RepID=UPI002E34D743|nr:hypothetical protein [Streptomyces sp. NBC_01255]